MHRLGKWMRALALVGQLGFCIITPPLVLVYLANLLVTKHGWGTWITIVAILFGLLCAAVERVEPDPEHPQKRAEAAGKARRPLP